MLQGDIIPATHSSTLLQLLDSQAEPARRIRDWVPGPAKASLHCARTIVIDVLPEGPEGHSALDLLSY